MKLSYYNEEVDRILWDTIGNDSFIESDKSNLVDHVTRTIYLYNTDLSKDKLKLVVQFLIEHKYQKYYVYDTDADLNKVVEEKKTSHALTNTDTDTMSVDIDMIDEDDDRRDIGDKVQLASADDLVCHRHDYSLSVFKEEIYTNRRKRIVEIKKIPQYKQGEDAWLIQRRECITATKVSTALDEDPYEYPAELLLDKCGRAPPFVENENTHHGKKYEKIGNMFYSFRNNILVGEYGLIQHDTYNFIGASPDGICEKHTMNSQNLSKLVGRLLEIKFPKIRKINTEGQLDGDICPHQYYVQVQTQLYVTKMDECDFLQCQIEEYDSWEDFVQDSNTNIVGLSKKTNLEKGCLIQLLPKKLIGTIGAGDSNMCLFKATYIYPPKLHMTNNEIEKWISNEMLQYHKNELSKDFLIDRIIYWRLTKVACNLIKADTKWFESKIPMLKQFWDYVLFYRKNEKKLDSLVKYIEDVGAKNSAIIFAKVHKDYASVNKDTTYEPLYPEENKWRTKFSKKKENYQKYQEFLKNKSKFVKKKIVNV
jgi:putative phage-type endonuclease